MRPSFLLRQGLKIFLIILPTAIIKLIQQVAFGKLNSRVNKLDLEQGYEDDVFYDDDDDVSSYVCLIFRLQMQLVKEQLELRHMGM